MAKQIFVNLPVQELDRSVKFFTAIGYTFDPRFTDQNATCMNIGENIYAMLLVVPFFKTFTEKEVIDPQRMIGSILCVSAESKQEVDEHVRRAVEAGGKPHGDVKDYGFMYYRSYYDLDGHLWEIAWMDPNGAPPQH